MPGLHAAEWVDSEREANMKAHRNFLLAVTLAAAAGTPAVGQKALPAVPASTVTQGAAAVPDFSGI